MFRSDLRFLKKLNDFNYFAETEFAILANKQNVNLEMLPIKIKNTRGSKINLLNLINYVVEALRFKYQYQK